MSMSKNMQSPDEEMMGQNIIYDQTTQKNIKEHSSDEYDDNDDTPIS